VRDMLYIYGGSERQQQLAQSMAMFMCKKYNIFPTIEINFKRLSQEASVGGCVECDDNEYEIDIKRSLKQRPMLVTLAHELMHVKQYELGELTQNSQSHLPYWDRPCEKEAHGAEDALFDEWARLNNFSEKKWAQYT